MMPATPSIDPARPGSYHPDDETPTRRIRQAPNEATTRRRAPPPHMHPTPRQVEPSPSRQAEPTAPQPAGSLTNQQAGSIGPQQPPIGSPLLAQGNYPAQYIASPLPHYESSPPQQGTYPPAQRAYPGLPGISTPYPSGQRSSNGSPAGSARAAPAIQYFYSPALQPTASTSNSAGDAVLGFRGFWHDLSLLGQVAGLGGVFLLIFFCLPWFFTPDFTSGNVGSKLSTPTVSYSGWHTASGLPIFDRTSSFDLFPHLWLIVVCSLALIALAALLGVQRISQRMAALLTSTIALFVLLLEFLFLLQANSIQAAVAAASGEKVNQTLYGVDWGFWLAVTTTIIVLGVGGFALLRIYGTGTRSTSHTSGAPSNSGPQFHTAS